MSAIVPTFAGEMQLAGWSESHTSGCKVTFWLQSPDDLEAFRALTVRKGNTAGHRFMAALVEIGDDEQPVQPKPEPLPQPEKPKGGPLAKLAGMWCNDPEFQKWTGMETADKATRLIYDVCHIESRAELDHDPVAAEQFHKAFRGPYSKYLMALGIVA
jgi:hypothetical protein